MWIGVLASMRIDYEYKKQWMKKLCDRRRLQEGAKSDTRVGSSSSLYENYERMKDWDCQPLPIVGT